MPLLAQLPVKEAEAAFHKAAESWGLATTILLTALIIVGVIVLVAIWKLVSWIKPKLDSGFSIHFGLVQALTDAVPGIKAGIELQGKHTEGLHEQSKIQTAAIDGMAAKVNQLTEKLEEWPSDIEKICKIEQVLRDAGFDEKVISRALKQRGLKKKGGPSG